MKLITGLFLAIIATNALAEMTMKETLLKAAQDKKNQEQAMELAKKGMQYLKDDKKTEVKEEAKPIEQKTAVAKTVKKKSKK